MAEAPPHNGCTIHHNGCFFTAQKTLYLESIPELNQKNNLIA